MESMKKRLMILLCAILLSTVICEKNVMAENQDIVEMASEDASAGSSMSNPINVTFNKNYSINWGKNGSPWNTYHKITISQQGLVSIYITKPVQEHGTWSETEGFYFRIYDSQGNKFIESKTPSKDIDNPYGYYEYSYGLKPGTYYFNIVPFFAGASSSNEVTASYYFYFDATTKCETELNNSTSTASVISLNTMNKASLGQDSTDYDYYKVALEAGHKYKVKIYNYDNIKTTYGEVTLINSSGTRTTLKSKLTNVDTDGSKYCEINIDNSGTYYLLISDSSGQGIRSYEIGIYDLTSTSDLSGFVERMYTVALGRTADSTGKTNWVNVLKAGTHDGAAIAREFILGQEFALRGLSNEAYVETLYKTFFDRSSDSTGKANWINHLAAGYSREFVLAHFVNSEEFTNLCQSFGVGRGVMADNGTSINPGVSKFVERLYSTVMGRNADWQGYTNWTMVLAAKQQSAEQVAKSFFTSQEYTNKNTSNTTFITDLYRTFFDREPDSSGLTNWKNCLSTGMTRNTVIAEFAKSAEFKVIAASYGLQ